MANPLKIQTNGSGEYTSLQVMSNEDMDYSVHQVLSSFVSNSGPGVITTDSSHTSIGSFVDTKRAEAVGQTTPGGAITTVSTTTVYQYQTGNSDESLMVRPIEYNNTAQPMVEQSDTNLNASLISRALANLVANGLGSYVMTPSQPNSQYTSILTLTNSVAANGSASSNTTQIWQRTTAAAPSTIRPLKLTTTVGQSQEFSDTEIAYLISRFRNRINSTGIGKYVLQESAPGSGTWVRQGTAFIDARNIFGDEKNYNQTYSKDYSTDYSTDYTKDYTITYNKEYGGDYEKTYTKAYGNTYDKVFTKDYAAVYTKVWEKTYTKTYDGNYSKTYTKIWVGDVDYNKDYVKLYLGNYEKIYVKTYTGTYTKRYRKTYTKTWTGVYTANYSATYSKDYSTEYAKLWTGSYTSAETFDNNWEKAYTHNWLKLYEKDYVGDTAFGGTSVMTYTKLYDAIYSGTYAGAQIYTGSYTGAVNYETTYLTEVSYVGTFDGGYTALDGFKLYMDSGNIASGEFCLYGLAQA